MRVYACAGFLQCFGDHFTFFYSLLMIYNVLVFGKNGYHGGSVWLGQKVRIILLVVKLMDNHAFLKIAY